VRIGGSRLRYRGWWAAVAIMMALGFWAMAGVAAPADVIAACASSAPAAAAGIEKLAAACPELESAIVSAGLDRMLPSGWRERLNSAQLQDLADIAQRYAGAAVRPAPGTASVGEILRGLKPATGAEKSWWQLIKDWFDDWVSKSDSALAKWLREFSGRVNVSPQLIAVIAYCLLALIVLAVSILALREMGLWRERRELTRGSKRAAQVGSLAASLPVPEQPNSAEQRLSRVLHALVLRLLETGRLSAERSLTHRELARRSRFDDEAQRGAFAGVTQVAEALVYGPRGAAQSAIPQAIERGEALLAQIQPVGR
jgi:hypothetical protein